MLSKQGRGCHPLPTCFLLAITWDKDLGPEWVKWLRCFNPSLTSEDQGWGHAEHHLMMAAWGTSQSKWVTGQGKYYWWHHISVRFEVLHTGRDGEKPPPAFPQGSAAHVCSPTAANPGQRIYTPKTFPVQKQKSDFFKCNARQLLRTRNRSYQNEWWGHEKTQQCIHLLACWQQFQKWSRWDSCKNCTQWTTGTVGQGNWLLEKL